VSVSRSVRLPVLLLGVVLGMLFVRTAAIELLFQYNVHHVIKPSRVRPQPVEPREPVRVLRA
jgi:hypothetical protein